MDFDLDAFSSKKPEGSSPIEPPKTLDGSKLLEELNKKEPDLSSFMSSTSLSTNLNFALNPTKSEDFVEGTITTKLESYDSSTGVITSKTTTQDFHTDLTKSTFGLDQVTPPESPFMTQSLLEHDFSGLKSTNTSETHPDPFTSFKSMTSSVAGLYEMQAPDFYESEDSLSAKSPTHKPKSPSDSHNFEADGLDEFLPKDKESVSDLFSTTATTGSSFDEGSREFESLSTKPENNVMSDNYMEFESLPTTTKPVTNVMTENYMEFESFPTTTKPVTNEMTENYMEFESLSTSPTKDKTVTNVISENYMEFTSPSQESQSKVNYESHEPKSDLFSGFETFESEVKNKESEPERNASPYDFYTKEPLIIPDDSEPLDNLLGFSSASELAHNVDKEFAVSPTGMPSYKLDEEEKERELEAKHAELSTFLQERDPMGGDEFDRSEDSISPNPIHKNSFMPQEETQNESTTSYDLRLESSSNPGYDYGFEFSRQTPDEIKFSLEEAGGFEQTDKLNQSPKFDEPPSPDEQDYGFEVIPPKVPPHRYIEEIIEEPPFVPVREPQVAFCPPYVSDIKTEEKNVEVKEEPFVKATKVEEKFAGLERVKVKESELKDHLSEFLPKESFETFPTVYNKKSEVKESVKETPVVETPSKKEGVVETKIAKIAEGGSGDVIVTTKHGNTMSKEAEQILNIFNPYAWFDPQKLHPTVSELVYWRDPKKSGAIFGTILVVLIALAFLSFISVVAYTSLAILAATFAFRVYKNILQAVQKTQEGHPFKKYLDLDLTLESDKTQEICNAVITYLNKTVLQLRHLFLVEDLVDSAKFGAFLYALTYIGSWFNGLTLVILAFVALFALPKVYESNKNVIDQYLDLAWAKISEVNSKVHAALPFGKKDKAQ